MKRILIAVAAVPVVMGTLMMGMFYKKAHPNPYPESTLAASEIPRFAELRLGFIHRHDKSALPFLASAAFDATGDGVPELFLGGGAGQSDALYQFKDGAFTDISATSGITKEGADPTYGAASLDVNQDGKIDLFVARESGIYLYTNSGSTFVGRKLAVPFNDRSVPMSFALADLNNDGWVDLYVPAYLPKAKMEGMNIFNKEGYGATSLLLLNNGDNTFKDITKESGLLYVHNSFQGVFVDLDEDRRLDLVVAHDTGHVKTWKNLGDLKFQDMPNPNSAEYSYPMGVGVGDYNNDGRPDLFFSNVGPTVPRFMARGDLRADQVFNSRLLFFRNDGGFKLTDVGAETRTADYEFSWGTLMEDFNLDGRQDLAIAQNFIDFPGHKFFRLPGRLLIQKGDGTFAAAEQAAGVENRLFAITPLAADWNGDGYPDLVYANLNGPARAFLNLGGGASYLKVALKDEPRSIGAVVTVETEGGRTLTGHFITSEGLCSDSSHVLTFGLGTESGIKRVRIQYITGEVETIERPRVNSTLSCQGPPPSAPATPAPAPAAPVSPAVESSPKPAPPAAAHGKKHAKGGGT
jgi:hypothetical protein